ncbi:hypothetical protein A2929_01920 [Candidatus Kaiserbacteria bacterium RIFCSPLOWO2_01_FULL_45_25]|uniref:Uncharacterized protein n=1 Tax=Candidatus Kaiserbacteria bacterium RIFCSPLOWO2_12_FULL_45_26 TaxID=1798525 RepID=A0A1F6FGM4_9BACT|nr:MAG: hypothetical protein A2Z56_04215 [Candidatus Kaiserbacteria bacterium RIFCSPHIGHO2_12_45_16]OGG71064.1 MAG: hypothetical protein A2929_01920 [Candidatus Kaiserbacteria bacterium RIFCSPLOWO2_01_FULL_45_25]OGG84990.1 MAG: hypothetical protein A3G90_02910 [Candidatus Kaiserbacteria bacterium RIFCSPLOWO2_12_FULL_45_26]
MSSIIGGAWSTACHLFVQYPFTTACAVVLGVGTYNVLTDEQKAECNKIVAACQTVPTPPPPVVIAPVAPPAPVVVVPAKPAVVDPCADAPVMTTADLFVSTGKPFLWKNPGIDPVRGKAPGPYLAQLKFTPAEQAIFLKKIAEQDGEVINLKKGDVIGLMTSGSGKLKTNTTVAFDPVFRTTGSGDYKNDGRMRIYIHEQHVRLNGDCVLRQMVLLEPFVCQNWSRISDMISPLRRVPDAVTPATKEAK